MQPVTITNLDRLLTALIQAKQRGDLEQTVIDCLPVEPGDAHIFGVTLFNVPPAAPPPQLNSHRCDT